MNIIRKPFKYTFVRATFWIIFANLAVFFVCNAIPDLKTILSLNVINCIGCKMWWQPFTYMFVHAGFQHILFNMLGLLFFGLGVERAIGSKEFLLMYFVCGVLSGLFSLAVYFFTGQHYVFLLGASGAVYAMLLAYAVTFPRSVILVWWIIPVPAPILVIIYALIEFFSQFGGGNVAHSTHLAGFGFAYLYFMIRMGINPWHIWFGRR